MIYSKAYLAKLKKWEKQSKEKPDQQTRSRDGEFRNGAAQAYERGGKPR